VDRNIGLKDACEKMQLDFSIKSVLNDEILQVSSILFTVQSVAERGVVMVSCLSVCPSVCDVGGL